jgi:hypothetical protein
LYALLELLLLPLRRLREPWLWLWIDLIFSRNCGQSQSPASGAAAFQSQRLGSSTRRPVVSDVTAHLRK